MEAYGVTIRSMRALRGPNLYAYMPVLNIVLDIGPYEEQSSATFVGFADRLTDWLPGLHTHQCSLNRPGGFVERLRRGTYLAHISEHVALELQTMMGFDVAFGRARGTSERGVYNVVIAYREEEPARAAYETALRLTLAAMHDEPFDIQSDIDRLLGIADDYRLGPSTAAIVQAARKCKIPVLRVEPTSSLVQLGWGVHQKRIWASQTSNTSSIAISLCQEKALTNRMLSTVGVPVPEGRIVTSADDAWAAAEEVGLPVVVKPSDGNQGKGVSVNLRTEAEIGAAYGIARDYSREILVERYIAGEDFRLLVVNGTMIAAARRDPAQVIGDGTHTIAELVAQVNQDPQRRPGHSSVLTRIKLDDAVDLVLQQQELTVSSVPEAGRIVKLRTNGNLSTGGTATDVTDEVHPRNARLAELAAQILGLDVAGIDMLCHDIGRPLHEQGGAIVEVNAAPGLRMHIQPTVGQPRDVGGPIVEMLYPGRAPSRIPIIAVTGTNGKTTVTRLISHMYETARWLVGMTCTEGTFIDSERIMEGDCSGPRSARAVLLHPRVEVAILETARGGILREGLGFDRCSVGAVTNVSPDHLGLKGIDTLQELARVKQVVVENVSRDGAAVLNAEDPLVAEMAAATDAEIVYFSTSQRHHVSAAHRAEGGRSVHVEDGWIVLATGEERIELVELDRIPFTAGGKLQFQVENALAAVAAAWAAGLNPAMIARALSTFSTDFHVVPGRFNVLDHHGVEVVLDYGHNTAAVAALGDAVNALGRRRTVLMITLPGDRRDEDFKATMDATRAFADEYVIYDSQNRRGRAEGEIPRVLAGFLPPEVPRSFATDQAEAFTVAWERLQAGDRLVAIADEVEHSLEHLYALGAAHDEDGACATPFALEVVAG
ncbi:MAG TPA: cyanophycin synthetase [Herpetosiphonaceae bacterium]|nr:cyanophycin synthetase [Herpetosiphonaceae bacterium]